MGCYKQLNTVEQGFRDLKDVIEMRPICHHKDDRVQGSSGLIHIDDVRLNPAGTEQ